LLFVFSFFSGFVMWVFFLYKFFGVNVVYFAD
jgi:hypothetical protein